MSLPNQQKQSDMQSFREESGQKGDFRVDPPREPASAFQQLEVVAARLSEIADLIRAVAPPATDRQTAPAPRVESREPAPSAKIAPLRVVEPGAGNELSEPVSRPGATPSRAREAPAAGDPAPVAAPADKAAADTTNFVEFMDLYLGAAPGREAPRPVPESVDAAPPPVVKEQPVSAPVKDVERMAPISPRAALPTPLPGFSTRALPFGRAGGLVSGKRQTPVESRQAPAPRPGPASGEVKAEAGHRDFYGAVEALRKLTIERKAGAAVVAEPASSAPPVAVAAEAAVSPPRSGKPEDAMLPRGPVAAVAPDEETPDIELSAVRTTPPRRGPALVVRTTASATRPPAPREAQTAQSPPAPIVAREPVKPAGGDENDWPASLSAFAEKGKKFAAARVETPEPRDEAKTSRSPARPQSSLSVVEETSGILSWPRGLRPSHGMLAAGVAALAGCLWLAGPRTVDNAPVMAMLQDVRGKLAVMDRVATRDELAIVRDGVADVKGGLDDLNASTSSAISSLRSRIETLERVPVASAETVAPVAPVVPVDRKQSPARAAVSRTIPGSTGAPDQEFSLATPIYISGARPSPIIGTSPTRGFVVREIYHNGSAVVENAAGRHRVSVGEILPGVGKVEAIELRGKQWVVVTARGLINSGVN